MTLIPSCSPQRILDYMGLQARISTLIQTTFIYSIDNDNRITEEEVKDGRAHAKPFDESTQLLDTPGAVSGLKPSVKDTDVHIRPIPISDYSIRMWGTNLEQNHEYCIDFVETATSKPENSPFKYELWAVPNKRTPWLPSPTQRLSSLERCFGVKEKDIKPGEEKFLLMEGTACVLKVNLADLGEFDELDSGSSATKCCKSIDL
ncbi:hypothetical protein Agabi119p4_11024 [Agaricus bisporus var. burnettii]|uniref:Uncharacterized protein n=1 Tax=Agaricus bisporus var. burnettii TaxID=192524 RepID=A0A8H7C187_AGABI|nr:hypothetical protein Agabi119p4_11024 [Agaricus bisporus var. burnettii]